MKKIIWKKYLMITMVLLGILLLPRALQAKEITVTVDGIPMALEKDSKPFIVRGRTMVPLRAISTYFDCEVEWIAKGMEDRGNVYITPRGQTGKYEMSYFFIIGSHEYTYGGPNGDVEEEYQPKTYSMDVAPMIANDRTFVPLRVIGEIFGTVEWDAKSHRVTIITGKEKEKSPSVNQWGMAKGMETLINQQDPNGEIVLPITEFLISPQILNDVFVAEPMNQKYVNSKYNYEVYYPEYFTPQMEYEGKEGKVLFHSDSMGVRVEGGKIKESVEKDMKKMAPGGTKKTLGKFTVYELQKKEQGFIQVANYISDGETYMAIKYGAEVIAVSEAPSIVGFNRFEHIELFVENALYHFADTH